MQAQGSQTFWHMVDGVLVLNLDSRPDRWRNLQQRSTALVPAGMLQRLPAVAGVELPGYGELPWFRSHSRDRTWAGRAGCALSHRNAIEHAQRAGWRTLLILEDDIELSAAINTVLAGLPAVLQRQDWDVCYLGYTDPVAPYRTLDSLPDSHDFCRVAGCNTAHAYLLRDSTFAWLLDRLPDERHIWQWLSWHRAIDRWYYRNLARRFRVCAVSPSLINQIPDHSDITGGWNESSHLTTVPDRRSGVTGFRLLGMLRWLQFRLAEPRDWLRGQIKRARGF